jgi:death on curing protein
MPSQPVFLGMSEVLRLHEHQLQAYGGGAGVRDLGMLESALAMPNASFGDQYLHTDIFEMAAAYLFHLCQNHPFVDGNKRVAAAAAFSFLYLNGWELSGSQEAFRDMVLDTASGRLQKPAIAAYLKKHAKKARR